MCVTRGSEIRDLEYFTQLVWMPKACVCGGERRGVWGVESCAFVLTEKGVYIRPLA